MLPQRDVVTPPAVSPDADRATQPVTDTAMPNTRAKASCPWQPAALTSYAVEVGMDGAHLRDELATRVFTLTGCAIPDSVITADPAARRAIAAMDEALFQLQGRSLILLRRCAHCGTGLFGSPPIESRSDLGYALAAWTPYHPDCAPTDPPADASW
jgi:hypothetical protein